MTPPKRSTTVTSAPPVPATPALVTAEDLLRYPDAYEHGELWDGRFVVSEGSGGHAEIVNSRVIARLVGTVDAQDLGWVTGSNQGFYVRRDPDRVLCPDAAYT